MNLNRLTIVGLGAAFLLGLVYFPLNERRGSPESPVFESRPAGNMPGTSSNVGVDTQPNGGPSLSYLNFGEVAADLSGLTREELVERFNPRPRAPMSFAEAIGGGDPFDPPGLTGRCSPTRPGFGWCQVACSFSASCFCRLRAILPAMMPSSNRAHMGRASIDWVKGSGGVSSMATTKQPTTT